MVDLGLYNYIKNAVAQGTPKETIQAELAKGGWAPELIEDAYAAVATNQIPQSTVPVSPVIQPAAVISPPPTATKSSVVKSVLIPFLLVVVITILCCLGYVFWLLYKGGLFAKITPLPPVPVASSTQQTVPVQQQASSTTTTVQGNTSLAGVGVASFVPPMGWKNWDTTSYSVTYHGPDSYQGGGVLGAVPAEGLVISAVSLNVYASTGHSTAQSIASNDAGSPGYVETPITISGIEGAREDYDEAIGGTTMHETQIYLVKNERVYGIGFSVVESKVQQYQPILAAFLNSIQIS